MQGRVCWQFAAMVWSIGTQSLMFCVGVEDIRQTDVILTKDYRHLSVANGAVWWESGLIRNYHDFGTIGQRIKGRWLPEGDGPIRLIHALFTIINDNFIPSTNPSYPAVHMHIPTIANIITYLEHVRTKKITADVGRLEEQIVHDLAFQQSVEKTVQEKKEAQSGQEKNKRDTQRLYKALQLKETKEALEQRLQELMQLKGKEKNKAQKEVCQITKRLETIATTKTEGDCNRVRELAEAILDAHNHSAQYPPYTAYSILLAFLYKKAQARKEPHDYYQMLRATVGPEVFINPQIIDDPVWLAARFCPDDIPAIQERLKTLFAQHPESCLWQLCDQLYEEAAYAQIITRFYRGAMPKKAEYEQVQFNGHVYPDCVETVLRNLLNIHLYDRSAGIFDVKKATHFQLEPDVRAFYEDEKNKQATNVQHREVYQNWADILCNRPWITYRSIMFYKNNKPIVVIAPEDVEGFIRGIPQHIIEQYPRDGDRIQIAGRWFIHVDQPDKLIFEMFPTVRNFIVIFNQLLGLNLYESEAEAFPNPHFNATYFPQLCQRLEPLRRLTISQHELDDLDERDNGQAGIQFNGHECSFVLLKNHAEYSAQQKRDSILDCAPEILKRMMNVAGDPQHFNLFSLFSSSPEQIPPHLRHQLMFCLDLQNHEEKMAVLHNYLQPHHLDVGSPECKQKIISTAANILAALPVRMDWKYQLRFIESLDQKLFDHPSIDSVMQKFRVIAYQRLYTEKFEPEEVPNYFAALVQRGQAFEDGIHIAREYMRTVIDSIGDPVLRDLAKDSTLKLYLALVQQGQPVKQEALSAAKQFPGLPMAKRAPQAILNQ